MSAELMRRAAWSYSPVRCSARPSLMRLSWCVESVSTALRYALMDRVRSPTMAYLWGTMAE
jgi:hypothetical protein